MHAIMMYVMFYECVLCLESKSLTGAGKSYPGLILENKLLLPLGMIAARIPVGEDDSVVE